MMKRVLCVLATMVLFLTACSQQVAPTWQEQYDLGVRYLSEGNYEEAIIAFTAAIEIDPKQAPAYVGRGDAYIGLGKTNENLTLAQADYEAAIGLDETYTNAYIGLAQVYIYMGNYDAAEAILQQGAEKAEDSQAIETELDVLKQKTTVVKDISFERLLSETESAVITGLDESGNPVWQYTTEKYERTELWRIEEIGIWARCYFFVENGAVVALNADTGEELWRNGDFQGSFIDESSYYIDGSGTIHLCGYYGPDFFAVDINGQALCRISSFSSDYYWASSIQPFNDTVLCVELLGGPDGYHAPGEGYVFYLDTDSFTYSTTVEEVISTSQLSTTGDGEYTIGICQLVENELLDAATQGFQDALTELLGTAVQFEYRNAGGDILLCSDITDGFVESKVDLIMAASTHALQAASSSTADIPIVGTCVTDYALALGISNWSGTTGRNIAGTSDRDISKTTENYYDLGYDTGLMAYDVLVGGATISSMPIQY